MKTPVNIWKAIQMKKVHRFCGRKTVEKFSYCPLHLMMVYQPKGKKKKMLPLKEDEVPNFFRKKSKICLVIINQIFFL